MTVTLKPKSEITVPKSIRRKAGIKSWQFIDSLHTEVGKLGKKKVKRPVR